LSGAEVKKAGWLCFLVALLLGAVLVYHGGLVILLIGIFSLAFGYLYTGGPYPLAYNGLGDLFVLIFFGIVAVSGTTFLLTQNFSADALIAGIQVGLLAVTLIAINNLRDIEGDRAVDKRTLAVILGERGARVEIILTLFVPFLLGLFWYGTAFYAFVLPLLAIPLAVHLAISVWCTRPSQAYNSLLARAALLHVLFGMLLAVGFLIDT
jgi:1,4-dihydroxy-2-naphthoate octaprenyltransferase